jgi:hypothetical protein
MSRVDWLVRLETHIESIYTGRWSETHQRSQRIFAALFKLIN